MLQIILQTAFKMLTASFTKKLITKGVSRLIVDEKDGITHDVDTTMIQSIVESKMNDITPEMLDGILEKLKSKGK